jgi:hypothetical protein
LISKEFVVTIVQPFQSILEWWFRYRFQEERQFPISWKLETAKNGKGKKCMYHINFNTNKNSLLFQKIDKWLAVGILLPESFLVQNHSRNVFAKICKGVKEHL